MKSKIGKCPHPFGTCGWGGCWIKKRLKRNRVRDRMQRESRRINRGR